MIDIHTHILPYIDDGSDSSQISIELLKEAQKQGVTDVFLTPHYRLRYKREKTEIVEIFEKFCDEVKKENLNVNLYLGQEIYYSRSIRQLISNGNLLSLNNSKYVLVEFSYMSSSEIDEMIYEITLLGYVPVLAHVERFDFVSIGLIKQLKSLGALVQINAGSLFAGRFSSSKRKAKKLLKLGLVDFVASDVHSFRPNYLQKANEFIAKKFGRDVANKLFIENAKKVINNQDII